MGSNLILRASNERHGIGEAPKHAAAAAHLLRSPDQPWHRPSTMHAATAHVLSSLDEPRHQQSTMPAATAHLLPHDASLHPHVPAPARLAPSHACHDHDLPPFALRFHMCPHSTSQGLSSSEHDHLGSHANARC